MWEVDSRGSNFIISIYVIFTKVCKERESKDLKMNVAEIMIENTLFEVEVCARDTSSSEPNFIVTPNYHCTRDKIRRDIVSSQRYSYASLVCHYLNMDKRLQNSETWTFREAFERKVSQR